MRRSGSAGPGRGKRLTRATTHRPSDVAGITLALVAAVSFGTLAIFGKLAYRVGAAPIPLLAARFAVASLLLLGYVIGTERTPRVERGQLARLISLGAFGYATETVLFFSALERASAGVVSLVFYSYPMWTVIVGSMAGLERLSSRLVTALALGTGGVVLIFSLPGGALLGPLLALGAALAVALFFVATQVVIQDVDPICGAMWTAVGAALALAAASFLTGGGLPAEAVPHAFALGLATAIAFATIYEAIVRIGAPRASIAAMFEPVTTIALAALFLGESLTLRIVIGALLIVSALPLLATAKRREPLPAPDTL